LQHGAALQRSAPRCNAWRCSTPRCNAVHVIVPLPAIVFVCARRLLSVGRARATTRVCCNNAGRIGTPRCKAGTTRCNTTHRIAAWSDGLQRVATWRATAERLSSSTWARPRARQTCSSSPARS
jgi:hypothetical protein